ncbi:DUF4440 domain-containing protein [Pseudalkalibacillus hwajinpoensis]|uniref:nuclear transport factor 2 family protein n=1 Tax=Guptibacillus hwajinpoensis TaxID=208199 RepID=UPI00325A7829
MNESASLLLKLEKQLLNSEVRKSAAKLNLLLAEDFMEFGSSGRIFRKKDVLDHLPDERSFEYVLERANVKFLENHTALVTYTLIKENKIKTLRSSIWRKHESSWQMIFHQGTRASI